MILAHLALFSFFDGASGVATPAPTPTPELSGGGGGVAKWPGRSEYGWEKWRRKEDKKRANAERRVKRLSEQVRELRFEIQRTTDLADLQELVRELEAIQIRLDKAQQILDEIEMQEVLLVWFVR